MPVQPACLSPEFRLLSAPGSGRARRAAWNGGEHGHPLFEGADLLAEGLVLEGELPGADRESGVLPPPVETDLFSFVDGTNEQADADGQQLDLRQRDADAPR